MATAHRRLRPFPRPRLPRDRPLAANEEYAPIQLDPAVEKYLVRVPYEGSSPFAGRVYRIPEWNNWSMEQRIAFMRRFGEDTARDPAISLKATRILRDAGVSVRDYKGAWAALLKWVQGNIRFTPEQREKLQSAQATLTLGHGDCDDCCLCLFSLAASLRLDSRFVLTGRNARGERIRWVEGTGPAPKDTSFSHVFLYAMWPPFRPTHGAFAEPTLDVSLGWDSMKDPPPADRADLGGENEATLPARTLKLAKGLPAVASRGIRALPWTMIAGTVVASVISFLVTQRLLARSGKRR